MQGEGTLTPPPLLLCFALYREKSKGNPTLKLFDVNALMKNKNPKVSEHFYFGSV